MSDPVESVQVPANFLAFAQSLSALVKDESQAWGVGATGGPSEVLQIVEVALADLSGPLKNLAAVKADFLANKAACLDALGIELEKAFGLVS